MTGISRFASRKFFCRSASVSGIALNIVAWNSDGESPANAVNADTKKNKKTSVFIKPLS